MAIGDIVPIATHTVTSKGDHQNIIHINGNVYAIVYDGNDSSYGWISTVSISDDGTTINNLHSFAFQGTPGREGYKPDIIHISNHVYAITYTDDWRTWVVTVHISDDGLTIYNINMKQIDGLGGTYNRIYHVSGNVYAITHQGEDADGWISTISISYNGLTISNISRIQFIESLGSDRVIPVMIHISGNVYAISCGKYISSSNYRGYIITLNITPAGNLSLIASYNFNGHTPYRIYSRIINVYGNVYAIAYDSSDSKGRLLTIHISDNGASIYSIASVQIDKAVYLGSQPDILCILPNVYAISYRGTGFDGWLTTYNISDDGVTLTKLMSERFNTMNCWHSDITHIDGNVYAVAYEGGWDYHNLVTTMGVITSEPPAARHRFTGGMVHRVMR